MKAGDTKKTKAATMTGRLHIARSGAGFLVDPETDKAIWIEERDLGTALPDDEVTIRLKKSGDEGVLTRIVERAERSIVGTVTAAGRFTRVQPLNPAYRQEFLVTERNARGAKVGERVVMRLVRWEKRVVPPEGAVTDIIGPADNPSLDTRSVMAQYELPEAFPAEVIAEAERVSAKLKTPGKRLDLRRKFIFTCDPESARDYDDALSLETDKNGNRVLGVHIADVSHFVEPNSELDREAYRRSTSVYLVDKVVPMLPEQLSNGVCSLVPGEDRLAFSAFLTFDAKGNCVARRFAKSVIRSKARFTYEQVMALIDGAKVKGVAAPARKTVLAVHALAQELRAARFKAGALDMDVPEAEVKLDAQGNMTGLVTRPYDASHQMVEECMVAANEAVAKELWSRGIKILARLHDAPDPEKLEDLRASLTKLGIACGDLTQPKNLARFLKKIKGSPLEGTLNVMVLRSMKRALYVADRMGHYGLAKKFYSHFTSPIRRYPDLTLHRQLASFVAGRSGRIDTGWLKGCAAHASACEQNADDAERSLIEIKKYRYLEALLKRGAPAEFDAVVGKCARFGVFVDLPELLVGGMVHISRLSDGYVVFDEADESLSCGSQRWRVGDKIRVRLEKVDFDKRQIDFVPAGDARVHARLERERGDRGLRRRHGGGRRHH